MYTGLLSDGALSALQSMDLEKLVVSEAVPSSALVRNWLKHIVCLFQVTNTICQKEKVTHAQGKLESMDVSPLLAESIRRVSLADSLHISPDGSVAESLCCQIVDA